jgi:hypothetical protein
MFCIFDSWWIKESVFANNTLVWIAGQYTTEISFILTFGHCYFDEFPWKSQGKVMVELDDCNISRDLPAIKDGCPTFTTMEVDSNTVENVGIIIGSVAGVVVLVAAGAIVCVIKRRRQSKNGLLPPSDASPSSYVATTP